MKTLIKVVKRGSQDNKDSCEPAVAAKPRLTTEMIVKSWIIEGRNRRRAEMDQLQIFVGWKGLAHGSDVQSNFP